MGIGTSDQDADAGVVGYQNVGLTNLTLSGLTLDDYTKYYVKIGAFDASGNNSGAVINGFTTYTCLLYTSPSPRDLSTSRMPSSA